jgi:5-oxoprolinase (ATP-hydrolysing) subunit A
MTLELDLNCDLGEGCAFDAELMPLITTANVACGFHAGGPAEARTALILAKKHGVSAGAHPGFPDREHFGRRELERSEEQILQDCIYQIGALVGLARAVEIPLTHVKAHGALYNLAMRDDCFAHPIIAAAELFGLPIMGLPDSRVQTLCAGRIGFIPEGYADRRYRPDGSLVPRSEPGAFVESPAEAVQQALRLLRAGKIRTLCVHGDNPHAVEFVRHVRSALLAEGVNIKPAIL